MIVAVPPSGWRRGGLTNRRSLTCGYEDQALRAKTHGRASHPVSAGPHRLPTIGDNRAFRENGDKSSEVVPKGPKVSDASHRNGGGTASPSCALKGQHTLAQGNALGTTTMPYYPGRCPGLGYAALWLRPNFVSGLQFHRLAETHGRASLRAMPSICPNYDLSDLYDAHDFPHAAINHVFHINHSNHSSDSGPKGPISVTAGQRPAATTTPHPRPGGPNMIVAVPPSGWRRGGLAIRRSLTCGYEDQALRAVRPEYTEHKTHKI
jgi:hypothetical protein